MPIRERAHPAHKKESINSEDKRRALQNEFAGVTRTQPKRKRKTSLQFLKRERNQKERRCAMFEIQRREAILFRRF